jgi:hypothetical protein
VANLSAALEGASQGLDQLAERANQREMMEAEAMRAENLTALKNYYTTGRELAVTGARGRMLIDVSDHRDAAEHTDRDEEIDRQEQGRAQNQAAAQGRSLSDAEALQNSAFTNQAELQARAQGHAGRAQDRRTAMGQIIKARAAKSQTNAWISNYQQQKGYTQAQLLNAAKYDPVLRGKFSALSSADALEQSARGMLDQRPALVSPYGTSAPSTMPSGNPALMSIPQEEGPGISDEPYPPSDDAADQMGLSPADTEEAQDPTAAGSGPGGV